MTKWASLFVGVVSIGLSIGAIVLMALLIQNNATQDVNRLQTATTGLEIQLTQVESDVPAALLCGAQVRVKEIQYQSCLDAGNGACSNLTTNFIAIQDNVTALTVDSLQRRLTSVIETCANGTAALRYAIAQASTSTNLPVLLANGTSTVTPGPIQVSWERYRFSLGGFIMEYVSLLPWPALAGVSPSGTWTLHNLTWGTAGLRPLLAPQQAKWTAGGVAAYETVPTQLIFRGVPGAAARLGQRLILVN